MKTFLQVVGVTVLAVLVYICLIALWLSQYKTTYRELTPAKTRQMVRDLIGRELPADTKDFRGVYTHSFGPDVHDECVFVAFHAESETQAYMRETFGSQHVTEFPDKKNTLRHVWGGTIVERGCSYPRKSDVPIFDRTLLEQVQKEATHVFGTDDLSFPPDAVRGYRLAASVDAKTHYEVFIFTDRNLVYLGILKDQRRRRRPETASVEEHIEPINKSLRKANESI